MINNNLSAVEYLVEQLMPKALTEEQYYHIQQAKKIENESKNKFIDEVQNEIRKVQSYTHIYQGSLAFAYLLLELEELKTKQ